jgi:hypothetical protein
MAESDVNNMRQKQSYLGKKDRTKVDRNTKPNKFNKNKMARMAVKFWLNYNIMILSNKFYKKL